jgi:hypothetical protein
LSEGKLEESKPPMELLVAFKKEELEIIIHALSSAQPLNKELEVIQFKLYHRMRFNLNEFK